MLVKVGIVIVGVLACLAGFIAMQPDTYRVSRTAEIAAPPDAVFALINDFHNWENWSPWAKLDPNMKTTYSGPSSGAGASYHWVGDDKVGEGRMTIASSQPASHIRIKLEFIKPFASNALTDFTVTPSGPGSKVEWTMTGESNFLSKGFGLVMGGMDKAIGPDFEKGLVQMKAVAEKK
ncbi:MAG TPA: SRPBCC family protein [Bryobacteraceae bacterium]|nr:SRPBCC family protein [Bryobacteraceae bacterium]